MEKRLYLSINQVILRTLLFSVFIKYTELDYQLLSLICLFAADEKP